MPNNSPRFPKLRLDLGNTAMIPNIKVIHIRLKKSPFIIMLIPVKTAIFIKINARIPDKILIKPKIVKNNLLSLPSSIALPPQVSSGERFHFVVIFLLLLLDLLLRPHMFESHVV